MTIGTINTIDYLELADFLLIAEAVLQTPAKEIAKDASLNLADSALHAPRARFVGEEFYPEFPTKAAVLGAQWVAGHADPALARAAQDLIAKIADTVPERLRPFVLEPASRARPDWRREPDRIDMSRTRAQIHEGKKIALRYRDEHGRDSERTIWPIAMGYLEAVRVLAAWCELRRDFRSFRTDRVIDAEYLEEKYPERRDILRARWRRSLVWEQPGDS